MKRSEQYGSLHVALYWDFEFDFSIGVVPLCIFGSFLLFGFGGVATRVVLVDFLAGSCI